MKTFYGQFSGKNFIYSDDIDAIRLQLISILNTPIGSRFYCPTYGSNLNKYKFAILNYFTINMIGQEIKNAVDFISGVALKDIGYYIVDNKIYFNIVLTRLSGNVEVNLTVVDGVAS